MTPTRFRLLRRSAADRGRRRGTPLVELASERRGAMAITLALMAVPIFLTVGGAVDYSRSVHFRAELQAIADSASLAAATVYDGTTQGAASATSMANAYLAAGETRLPQYESLTATVSPTPVGTGEQVVVTLTATMNTTFLGIMEPSITFTATSTALNPFPYGHILPGYGGADAFSASAADTNTIYWYNVPTDNSIPPDSALTVLWSNKSGVAPTEPPPIPLTPNQQIGFAMRNTTGNYGTYSCGSGRTRTTCSYTNQYGSTPGTTHTMYSHVANPSDSTSGYNATDNATNVNGVNGATPATGSSAAAGAQGNNCTLQMVVVNSDGTASAPVVGACFTSAWTYAAPTCKQLNGKSVVFYWNDMGGTTDDKDYNDAVFTYFCGGNGTTAGGASTGPTSVVLTQ